MKKKQFLSFVLSGGVAGGLNWGSRFFFSQALPFEVAVVLAFLVGLSSGFILMRLFVFDADAKPVIPQICGYVVVNLFALIQTLLISIALARWLLPSFGVTEHAEALAHLFGVVLPVLTSYFGHRYLTFR